ncbi:MAG: hypothetical protein HC852_04930 [Acaryochloridaceae cyanobacterium RU_4_10]|nr:hypothetical protein [Acaryochloridaceae cyanobacterium RU_4_10]
MENSKREKERKKSNVYSSIDEWEKRYVPKTWHEEKYQRLSENPEELAKILAEDLIKEVEAQYSL